MDNFIPLLIVFVAGIAIGGYIIYTVKAAVLPKDMDTVVVAAMTAITQVQAIYGNNTLGNAKKAAESLDIASRALKDSGITINANTLALVIRVAYHVLKPEVKALPSIVDQPDHK